jgi:GNAT superfamily N-acetyltransferase
MEVSIRAATVGDARAIAEIHVAGWRAAYRGQMPDALLDSLSVDERAEKRRLWLEKPASPDVRNWVAEEPQPPRRIVGWACTGPARGEESAEAAELWAIYLDPTLWRRGIGRALHDFALQDLRKQGRTVVILWVLDTNMPARRFYEALGWTCDGGEKSASFGGTMLKEVRYRRDL